MKEYVSSRQPDYPPVGRVCPAPDIIITLGTVSAPVLSSYLHWGNKSQAGFPSTGQSRVTLTRTPERGNIKANLPSPPGGLLTSQSN